MSRIWSTVDVPGVIISIPWRLVGMDCTLFGAQSDVLYRSLYGCDFHIGVGSDVVCSTLIGSWKSLSVWNRQQDDSTLFFCRNLTDFCLEKS